MPLFITLKVRGPMKLPMQFLIVDPTAEDGYSWTTDPTEATPWTDHTFSNQFLAAHPELPPIAQNYTYTF